MVLNMLKVFGIKGSDSGSAQGNPSHVPPLPPLRGDISPEYPTVSSPRLSFLRARGRFAAGEDARPSTGLPQFQPPGSPKIPSSPPPFRKPPLTRSGQLAQSKVAVQPNPRKGIFGKPSSPVRQAASPPRVSLSAPPSPGGSRASGIKSPIMQRSQFSNQKGLPPRPSYSQPPANICVEKGRIEFVAAKEEAKPVIGDYEKVGEHKPETVRQSKITPPKVDISKLPAKFVDSGYGEPPISPPVSPGMPRFIMPERRGDKSYSASSTPVLQRRADFVRSVSTSYDAERICSEVERKRMEFNKLSESSNETNRCQEKKDLDTKGDKKTERQLTPTTDERITTLIEPVAHSKNEPDSKVRDSTLKKTAVGSELFMKKELVTDKIEKGNDNYSDTEILPRGSTEKKPTNIPTGLISPKGVEQERHETKINVAIPRRKLCTLPSKSLLNGRITKERSSSTEVKKEKQDYVTDHCEGLKDAKTVECEGRDDSDGQTSKVQSQKPDKKAEFCVEIRKSCRKAQNSEEGKEETNKSLEDRQEVNRLSGSKENQHCINAAQLLPILQRMAGESCHKRLTHLQLEVARMEELMRTILPPCKTTMDFLCIDKAALTKAYERRLQEAHGRIARLELENRTLHAKLHHTAEQSAENEAGCAEFLQLFQQLRAENEALLAEAEQQRRQYERCLDDVATNVVQALMAQKALQGECQRLQRRVKELEQQNAVLAVALKRQLQATGDQSESSALDALLRMTSAQSEKEGRHKTSVSWDGSSFRPESVVRDSVCSTASDGEIRPHRNQEADCNWSLRPNKLAIARSYSDQPIVGIAQTTPCPINVAKMVECKKGKCEMVKDEGYSTMSSDGQGELKESDISTCSPLPLRKQLATRSLPARRKQEKPSLPNRSLSLQETLREVQEVSESSENSDTEAPPSVFRRQFMAKFTIKETSLSASSSPRKYRKRQKTKFRHSYHYERLQGVSCPLRRTHSDSEMTCHEPRTIFLEESLSSIDLDKCERLAKPHPLRRSKAHTELIAGTCDITSPIKMDESCLSGFSSDCEVSKSFCDDRHLNDEMENLSASLDDLKRETPKLVLPSIRENSVELEEDSSECAWNSPSFGQSAMPSSDWPFKNSSFKWEERTARDDLSACCSECSSIDCNVVDFPSKRSSIVSKILLSDLESPVDESKIDTDFTRDFYRLVKFESNRSLAASSKSLDQEEIPPPDKQVALQSVLDFIAEQQKYCASREHLDEQAVCSKSVQVSDSPSLAPPLGKRGSALEELSRFINGDDSPSGHEGDSDSDSGCTTGWVHLSKKAELMDKQLRTTIFNSMMITSSSSDCLSSCCDSCPSATVSPSAPAPPTVDVKKRAIPRLIRGKLFANLQPSTASNSRNIPSAHPGLRPPQVKPLPQPRPLSRPPLVKVETSNDLKVRRERLIQESVQRSSWTTVDSELDVISISDSCMGSMASSVEVL